MARPAGEPRRAAGVARRRLPLQVLLALLALALLGLAAPVARAEEQKQQQQQQQQKKKKTVPWGKSAVYIKGQWVPFDEADEAGVPQPYPPKTDSWKGNDTSVMVSISSFRDYRCAKTLYNLFVYVRKHFPRAGLDRSTCMLTPRHPSIHPSTFNNTQQGSQPRPGVRGRGAAEQRRRHGLPLRLLPHHQGRAEHRAQGGWAP